jgi:hypothetical protein
MPEIEKLVWKVVGAEGVELGGDEIPPDAISVFTLVKGTFKGGGDFRTIETIVTLGMGLDDLLQEVEDVIQEWEETSG